MVRVLVLSAYELGNQPLEAARALGVLRGAGHEADVVDLAVERAPSPDRIEQVDRVVCAVPMHTALRLANETVATWRAAGVHRPTCFLGLYAPTAAAGGLEVGDAAIVGPGTALLEWIREPSTPLGPPRRLGRDEPVPAADRFGLPALSEYARLQIGTEERLVGAVEASQGCNHRCRHCPVPIVYEGRSRAVPFDAVLAEIDSCVALGATHVSFSDPDFLNRPVHALQVARALHDAHPDLGFDATIKVTHLRRHEDVLGELARCGLLFIVSAFESTSNLVLDRLAKGHRLEDLGHVVDAARAVGVEIRPSLLPFTPWTTRADLVTMFDFLAAYDLLANVDPIQLTIRLLLPSGSLLLDEPDPVLAAALGAYDPAALGWRWRHADGLLDEIQASFAEVAERATTTGEDALVTHRALRGELERALSRPLGVPEPVSVGPDVARRARRTEAWFCCAEPTIAQRGIALMAVAPTCAPPGR